MSESPLQANEVTLAYDGNVVARDLSVSIPERGFTAIVGPNACGKSTLLRALVRMLKPRAGSVLLDGAEISSLPTKQVARRLGLLPQTSTAPDGITVEDLVSRGRHPYQRLLRQWSREDDRAVRDAMSQTAVEDLADDLHRRAEGQPRLDQRNAGLDVVQQAPAGQRGRRHRASDEDAADRDQLTRRDLECAAGKERDQTGCRTECDGSAGGHDRPRDLAQAPARREGGRAEHQCDESGREAQVLEHGRDEQADHRELDDRADRGHRELALEPESEEARQHDRHDDEPYGDENARHGAGTALPRSSRSSLSARRRA